MLRSHRVREFSLFKAASLAALIVLAVSVQVSACTVFDVTESPVLGTD